MQHYDKRTHKSSFKLQGREQGVNFQLLKSPSVQQEALLGNSKLNFSARISNSCLSIVSRRKVFNGESALDLIYLHPTSRDFFFYNIYCTVQNQFAYYCTLGYILLLNTKLNSAENLTAQDFIMAGFLLISNHGM